MEDNMIYVAVGKEIEDRKSILKWAFKKFGGKTICVLYVNIPSKMITLPNGFVSPVRAVSENDVKAFREWERQEASEILDDCSQICNRAKVPCQTICIEKETITGGILEIICQLRIVNLVMGAAANKAYSWRMAAPKSKKAYYVLYNAPDFCHIWLVCKGHLICTRGARQLSETAERNQVNRITYSETTVFSPSPGSAGSSSPLTPNMSRGSSPVGVLSANINDQLYFRLQQARMDSKKSAEEARAELQKRLTAEKETAETINKLRALERQLAQAEEWLKDEQNQANETLEKLLNATDRILSLEDQTWTMCFTVTELQRNVLTAEDLQKKYRKRCDDLQRELHNALYVARTTSGQVSQDQPSLDVPTISCEYSVFDLEEATNGFDPSLIIGKGLYTDVYRGFLNHTEVAIKVPHNDILQTSEIEHEVDVLSRLRHPNLVTLIGTCTNPCTLIYEYLPNGSLEDRLNRKDDSPPLPWQTRIRIATELCSALIFLHSRRPNSIVHSKLTLKDVLLDCNFICKLTGFGSSQTVPNGGFSISTVTQRDASYLDSNSTESRQINPKTDVYSFGILLLCLLTAKSPSGIVKKVRHALENNNLYNILDHSAGEWPFVRAKQLAYLAMGCCRLLPDDRPDLASEVWTMLRPNHDPSRSLSTPKWLTNEDQIPSYFLCPILQEIMHDPHFAADGFTYEADAIKGWFDGGHDTSPMTNLKLVNLRLTPNRALHSVIQDWLQKHQCV